MEKERYFGEAFMKEKPSKSYKFLLGEKVVKAKHLDDGAITEDKIADGAITMPKIASSVFSFPGDMAATLRNIAQAEEEVRTIESERSRLWSQMQVDVLAAKNAIIEAVERANRFFETLEIHLLDDGEIMMNYEEKDDETVEIHLLDDGEVVMDYEEKDDI